MAEPRQVIVARVQGKKSDGSFEDIITDDAGRLQVWDPKVGSLISYTGVATADGAALGASLIDALLAGQPDFDGCLVIITSGPCAGQARDINGITTGGTVTPSIHFGSPTGAGVQIVSGTSFVIAGITTTPAEVAAIEAKLDHATHGLAALKALLDDILLDTGTTLETKLDNIKTVVDAILVDTSTTLEGKLDAIGIIVTAILVDTGTTLEGKLDALVLICTAARGLLIDRLSLLAAGGAGELTATRAAFLDNINQAGLLQVTVARAALLDQITALRMAELDPANIPADIDTLLVRLPAILSAARIGYLDNINQAGLLQLTAARAGYLDKLPNFEHEVEWSSTPAVDQVADVAATSLTAGSIVPTFPAGSTRVRALLVASVHASNKAANTHNISIKVQGKKDAGAYGDLIDLTAQTSLGLVNLAGAGDGWAGSIDVTALVDASASTYLFKFIVQSDNAGAVNYTSSFVLVLVYKI